MTDYIGGVAALTVCEFIIIMVCCLYYYSKHPEEKPSPAQAYENAATSALQSIWSISDTALLTWRVLCFLWFLCFAITTNWIYFAVNEGIDPGYWYFTNWNLILLGIYFFIAALCSIQHRLDPLGGTDAPSTALPKWWTPKIRQHIVRIAGIGHDVAGANAIFVTVVALGILDPSPTFWNLTNHLSNSVFMFIELALNNIHARSENYVWNLTWVFVYVCFAWIIVYTGVRKTPYFFLKTVNKPEAFAWYVSR
jgi:hypothetical protein